MNISKIVEYIKEDSSITQDIPKFLTAMNLEDIDQVVEAARVVREQITQRTSIAKMNGGVATNRDVQAAIILIAAEDLKIEANRRFLKVSGAITEGTVKNSSEMISKFADNNF